MNKPYSPGDWVHWWPGRTDYPSLVKLLKPVDREHWLVNYTRGWTIPEPWIVKTEELGKIIKSTKS